MPLYPKTKSFKKIIGISTFLLLGLLLSSSAWAQKKDAFHMGEYLEYNIRYGVVRGGKATLEVKRGEYDGKEANHLYLNGRTVGVLDKLYKVNDIYQSFTNPQTDLPYMAIRDINEGRYSKYTVQTFDHWSRTDSTVVQSTATGKVLAPKDSHDILSAFYYLRNHHLHKELKVGDTLAVETYFSDEHYTLKVRFMGYETVKTSIGYVQCVKYIPVVITGRVFKKEDDMVVWFSNDANFIPIRIRFNIFLGAIYCDLDGYSGLMHPFESLIK